METDKIIVLISSIGISAFIYWYFLMHKDDTVAASGNIISIVVDGGYNPQTIIVKKDQKITLNFIRKDPSDCLEEVVLPDFGKRAFLPLNEQVTIEILPIKLGQFNFQCGMNMFHGKIIVEEV